MAQKLQQQLRDVGSKLETPPASKDALIKLLKQAANCLAELDQSPLPSIVDSIKPCLDAIAKQELLKHQDRDVKVLVASCICEITRITAPEAPYGDDVLRDTFHLIVGTFSGLSDINSPSFGRRVVILETFARYRSCVVMLDLECNDLINEMFSTFFSVVSDDHPKNVVSSMQTIMVLILDESEDIAEDLLSTILSPLGRKRNDFSMAARRLAMNIIEHCAVKLETCIKQFLLSSLSGDSSCLDKSIDYHEVIYDVYQCAPRILSSIVPHITGELLADRSDVRLKAVQLLGELFALPGISIPESFQPLFLEFLKRLTDRVVEIRVSVVEELKNCLMSNPSRAEAPFIIKALCDRLLDYDENVRKQVVGAIYDVACHSLKVVSNETAKVVAERLRDKSVSVKRYTMERLADLHKVSYSKISHEPNDTYEFEWVPGKILRCLYDKDFRSETIELMLCGFLFLPEFPIKDRVKNWATVFSGFDKVEVKALEQILLQKQRLQQELQKYLSLRQTYQEDAPELLKRTSGCFRNMARLFSDPTKAEEGFQLLNQLKDVNIWKLLTSLLDPCTSFYQAWSYRDELLKILGERHPLYDFMCMLSTKCSYLLFNKDYVKEILLEAGTQKSGEDLRHMPSFMHLLEIIASFSPQLFAGFEEDLVSLLKGDNEIVKEGIAHILAKAGGTIREQLATTSSSVGLLLERLCLEGSRKQAKYSVQALAAVTKDDGLKSLSVLYKRLVDMLEEKTHLPTILQSLGCIAQITMPIFETREDEIVAFIMNKILEQSNETDGISTHKTEWKERSELCSLKIFSIKTLVKSYLPVKDAHLRPGIENLVEILKKVLSFGDVSKDIISSDVDKAHMRLASAKAVLRLSRQWDHNIPLEVFYMTLRVSEDIYPQSRKLFIDKVHQYIKERLLDAKYACAFLLNINRCHSPEYKEAKHNLLEVVQLCQQVKVRQLSMQSEVSLPVVYPEYILAHLVHALVHHPSCPNMDECKDVKAFEPIYWRLHLFLSVLMHGDEGVVAGGGPERKKESYIAVASIFRDIKSSEDVLDKAKSKTSHTISDLGWSIAKKIFHDQADISELATSFSLPPTLYKPVERNESDCTVDNEELFWLSGENALAHFEALQIEDKVIVPGAAKDEMLIGEIDEDGNEVPLAEMMKILKSQGAKKKNKVKKHVLSSDKKNIETEIDVLGMVREMNLDNMKKNKSNEVGRSTKDHANFEGGWMGSENNNENVLMSRKRKDTNTACLLDVATPKRKRSASTKSHSKGFKDQLESRDLLSVSHRIMQPNLLVPSTSGKTYADRLNGGETICNDQQKPTIVDNANKEDRASKNLTVSSKKRKIRSISGLSKCSQSTKPNNEDLVGSRIKVWWPMDKAFYEGIVQSYDRGKNKHVILYDDGDVEVLHLGKEKWELIPDDNMPRKRPKYEDSSSHKEQSPVKMNKKITHAESNLKQNLAKKVKRKPTSKGEHHKRRALESENSSDESDVKRRGASDLSDVHSNSGSEVDHVNSEKHTPPVSEIEDKNKAKAVEAPEESEEEKPDPSSPDEKEDSDDEPLSAWRVRTAKAL